MRAEPDTNRSLAESTQRHLHHNCLAWVCCLLMGLPFRGGAAEELCPNPGAEQPGQTGGPTGWAATHSTATWATDDVHSGTHSLKITSKGGDTVCWTSEVIPLPRPDAQLVLSVWARLEAVTGGSGAYIVLYHMDGAGQRIGQSAECALGGGANATATTPWKQWLSVSGLTPEVKGVRVNLRLYGASGAAWFDDVSVTEFRTEPLAAPRPLRQGLRLTGESLAVCAPEGDTTLAVQIQSALRSRGVEVPVVPHQTVNLADEKRDLIILGNLAASSAAAYLYEHSYTYEDLCYPGTGGYVLRPLIDPLGTGANFLVVGASDPDGLKAGVERLAALVGTASGVLSVPLEVKLGRNPYPALGGYSARREMVPAVRYLTTGDIKHARDYRDTVLKDWFIPDEKLFAEDNALHLYYVTRTLSWDLMESCGVFSDEERLKIVNQLLKMLRSNQGVGYSGLRGGRVSRENHATRAAQAFYFGWRHFSKYYPQQLGPELQIWRNRLQEFWTWPLASSRSYEDSISQHALGGSLENTLDIAFMEPEWSGDFFKEGRGRLMGERCIAICNNMGRTVLLGDTAESDYPKSVFAKLAYRLRDGRYTFMIEKRQPLGASSDEPLRAFAAGVDAKLPEDHLGLKVIPADRLYFDTALQNKKDVPFENAFDKLTFRGGFEDTDEYLMLDGVAGGSHSYDDANSIGEYSANRRLWLCEIDIFNGPTMSFHNAVTVARGGLGEPTIPQAAELVTRASGAEWAYSATRLPHYSGVAWTRHLLWLKGGWVFALDEMTAEEPGDYSFVLGWRSVGEPTLVPGSFTSAQDDSAPPPGHIVLEGAELTKSVRGSSGKDYRCLEGYNAMFYRSTEAGDFVEIGVQVPEPADYAANVTFLKFTGRGILQIQLDGKPSGAPIDLWTSEGAKEESVSLGTVRLEKGQHLLRFAVTGKNALSDNATLAVSRVTLVRAGAKETAAESIPNRFRLLFPPNVPATLDRDTETLGKYLPRSPHYKPVLNILEQSMSRTLNPGEAACFQNLFYATAAPTPRAFEYRRLNEHSALVRSGDTVTLIGASVSGITATLGSLRAEGRMFCIGPKQILLHQATLRVGDVEVKPGQAETENLVREALAAAWKAATTDAGQKAEPWTEVRALREKWTADMDETPLAVAVCKLPQGMLVAAGTVPGTVKTWDARGAAGGSFKTGNAVHALTPCDLDGNGIEELLVGSDDEYIYALTPDLKERWKYQVPFLREEQIWLWWTLDSSKVRKIHCGDINGDGKPEILLGVGNMRLHCLDATGKELWRFRTDHGICTTIVTAPVLADGKTRVLAGNGLTSSNGNCWVLDENGKLLRSLYNDGWCTSLPAIAVADLNRDGKNTVFCGNNRGNLRAYTTDPDKSTQKWIRNLTRPIRSLTSVACADRSLMVVGADSGTLCAFDDDGTKAWGIPLSSAILETALLRRKGEPDLIVAACKDGNVFVVAADGRLAARFDGKARLSDLVTADVDGDQSDEIIIATQNPNRLHVIGWK